MLGQDIVDVLGLDALLAQMILAVGGAMVLGSGYAIYMHRRGRAPAHAEGEFRATRTYWLLGVGVLISAWGIASLITG
jgi:uncharacterized iron-regulated membrane protein